MTVGHDHRHVNFEFEGLSHKGSWPLHWTQWPKHPRWPLWVGSIEKQAFGFTALCSPFAISAVGDKVLVSGIQKLVPHER